MFKPVPFNPYGRRRSVFRLPRWLVLLLGGIAIGAAGVVLVQERYLPPRLSAIDSAQLRSAYQQADAERLQLKRQLADTTGRLRTVIDEKAAVAKERDASHATTDKLRSDLSSAVAALPPDPRGGSVEVRAGQFTARGAQLDYEVVLTNGRSASNPMAAVMQLAVTGDSASGAETIFSPAPVSLSIAGHEVARGSVTLPEGFKGRQATVRILDRVGGQPLGMRVLLVK